MRDTKRRRSGARKPQHGKRDEVSGSQSRRFIEAARELECDEDLEAFKRVVRQIAKGPPPALRKRSKKSDDDKPS